MEMVLLGRPMLAVAAGGGIGCGPLGGTVQICGLRPYRRDINRSEESMADDLVELHGRCGRRFAALVAGVGMEQWHDGTPCSEWDVRTLVQHLLSEQLWVPPMFEGLTMEQVGDRFDGDLMGDDASSWAPLLDSATEQAHAVVAQPGALARTVHLSFGDVGGEEYVVQLTADLAVHGWDLARATG